MLQFNKIPLSSKQVAELSAWINSPACALFVECLSSDLASIQAKIGDAYAKAKGDQPRMEGEADEEAIKYYRLVHCLEVLGDVKKSAGDLCLSTVTVSNEYTNNFISATSPAGQSGPGTGSRPRAKNT